MPQPETSLVEGPWLPTPGLEAAFTGSGGKPVPKCVGTHQGGVDGKPGAHRDGFCSAEVSEWVLPLQAWKSDLLGGSFPLF